MTITAQEIAREPRALPPSTHEMVRHFLQEARNGSDWAQALLEAISLWTVPDEEYAGRHFRYVVGGEAFDWLLLAERMCLDADGVIPADERERLLFYGQLPPHITEARFRSLLGWRKYRAHLNFWYGVVVEQALQLAVEEEAHKERRSKGLVALDDLDDLVHQRIYGATRSQLLREFYQEQRQRPLKSMSLADTREFTYWLFKRRLRVCDRARVASDTRKGLLQLQHMSRTPYISTPHP